MKKRKNTRVNTLFSEAAFDWLNDIATNQNKSMAQVVREKIELAKKEDAVIARQLRCPVSDN